MCININIVIMKVRVCVDLCRFVATSLNGCTCIMFYMCTTLNVWWRNINSNHLKFSLIPEAQFTAYEYKDQQFRVNNKFIAHMTYMMNISESPNIFEEERKTDKAT